MPNLAVIDEREISVTPVFKLVELENIPKSETAGYAVMETREVVEVRFAGRRDYSPTFNALDFWKREGNRVYTYLERWPEQYRQFKEGNPQEALGTPLEMLRKHGISPELISLCRVWKIYSVESLHHLEGQALKSLGMNANMLKEAARAYMAEQTDKGAAMDEIAVLRAEIAALKAAGQVPAVEASPEEKDAATEAADAALAAMTDEDIKAAIAGLNDGRRPAGNPSRRTLEAALRELQAA